MATGRPITIEFAADVQKFLRDTKKLDVSLEDIEAALKSAAAAADKSGAGIDSSMNRAEGGLRDFAAEAERAARDSGRAFRRMDDDAERAAHGMGDAGREAGSEFRQNLGQAIGSGGSLDEVIGETIGSLVGSVSGPLAGAFVAVGAAGMLAFNSIAERAERVAETTKEMVDTILGLSGRLDDISRKAVFQGWLQNLRDNDKAAEDFAAAIRDGVISSEELRDAVTGVPGAAAAVLEKMKAVNFTTVSAIGGVRAVVSHYQDGVIALEEQQDALGGTKKQLDDLNTVAGTASNYYKTLAAEAKKAREHTEAISRINLDKTMKISIVPADRQSAKWLDRAE